ncbi:acyl-[acyl-carrier-protein]--UDP-N-acetylglucosamine O-acyltransferase, partial [Francisella tularensis subsp. holarctica]|nr:acyl-[acyl-carrier-protein]--UDP-N-acetylglucosamine O-acyltransferase [Francisella tularensis subsp. holarctica]
MIHSLAVVHEIAKIADSAIIGTFCVIVKNVV